METQILKIKNFNYRGGGGYNTGISWYYNASHSSKFCAGKTAITPLTLNFHSNFFEFLRKAFFAG